MLRFVCLLATYVGVLLLGKALQQAGMADPDKVVIVGMALAIMYCMGEATRK